MPETNSKREYIILADNYLNYRHYIDSGYLKKEFTQVHFSQFEKNAPEFSHTCKEIVRNISVHTLCSGPIEVRWMFPVQFVTRGFPGGN